MSSDVTAYLWNLSIHYRTEGVENMAAIYVALIIKGKRNYADIPAVIKPKVKEMLVDLELEDLIVE